MATLTQGQIKTLAASVGMKDPGVMAAIAMAESSGNTKAHNANPPDDSYGLWQINMLGDMGPGRRREFGISKNEDLFNPLTNAMAAKKILGSQGLAAWSTYSSGAYKKYMKDVPAEDLPEGTTDADQAGIEDYIPGGDTLEGLLDIALLGAKAGDWMSNPKNWVRVIYVVGGVFIVVAGLMIITNRQVVGVVKDVAGGATSVLPGGGTARGLGKAIGGKAKAGVKKAYTKPAPPGPPKAAKVASAAKKTASAAKKTAAAPATGGTP